MTVKFKAVVIDNQNEKFTRDIKEIDSSHLKDGNVLIKIDYSSLNYKDALILKDGGKIVVEDTSVSYLKREFYNPSKYSFINYAKNIIDIIHRRSPMLNKNLNFYAKKIFFVEFFESIVVFSVDTKKCFLNKC